MMSDRPIPFSSVDDFREKKPDVLELLDCPEESSLVDGLDPVAGVVVRPQEQLEGTARELYSILGIEGDFIPQSELELSVLPLSKAGWSSLVRALKEIFGAARAFA